MNSFVQQRTSDNFLGILISTMNIRQLSSMVSFLVLCAMFAPRVAYVIEEPRADGDFSKFSHYRIMPNYMDVMDKLSAEPLSAPESPEQSRIVSSAPRKRSPIMFNRLLVALEHALDSSSSIGSSREQIFSKFDYAQAKPEETSTESLGQLLGMPRAMALTAERPEPSGRGRSRSKANRGTQRRHFKPAIGDKSSMIKCYFNAVTCF